MMGETPLRGVINAEIRAEDRAKERAEAPPKRDVDIWDWTNPAERPPPPPKKWGKPTGGGLPGAIFGLEFRDFISVHWTGSGQRFESPEAARDYALADVSATLMAGKPSRTYRIVELRGNVLKTHARRHKERP